MQTFAMDHCQCNCTLLISYELLFVFQFGGRVTISALLVSGCLSEDRKFLIASASGTSEGGD